MATLHQATLTPTKIELIDAWVPRQPWAAGSEGPYERVAACRLDDPAGAVGIELLVITDATGTLLHVPLTYRGAPLPGAEADLVGRMQHSVLGERWVYDAAADPVFGAQVRRTIVAGGTQADEFLDGRRRDPSATLQGTGADPAIGEDAAVTVHRVLGPEAGAFDRPALRIAWADRTAIAVSLG